MPTKKVAECDMNAILRDPEPTKGVRNPGPKPALAVGYIEEGCHAFVAVPGKGKVREAVAFENDARETPETESVARLHG